MPRYSVIARRLVEEVGEVFVEADTPEQAVVSFGAAVRRDGVAWARFNDTEIEAPEPLEVYAIDAPVNAEPLWRAGEQ